MSVHGILGRALLALTCGVAVTAGMAGIPANAAAGSVTAGTVCSPVSDSSGGGSPGGGSSATTSALAEKLSRDILAALRDRPSSVGLEVDDPDAGLACDLSASRHFDSASTVKATILAALLHKRMEEHRSLSSRERQLATEMITESDNDAASDLWDDVGRASMQHFLDLAKMTQTILGAGPYWGLTQITARDETLLLGVLTTKKSILSATARDYELRLMASVIPDQRWGVSAGTTAGVTVHLKNGWLPLPSGGWVINSIGCFAGPDRYYSIVVLTDGNPSMDYGIATIEDVARVVNRVLDTARLG
jgi:Beta-lactamase enzyme family